MRPWVSLIVLVAGCHLVFPISQVASTSDADAGPGGDGTVVDGARGDEGGASGAVCSPDNWCWEHPLPQGNTLYGVWGAGPGDIFAVGQAGTILRYDGSRWGAMISGRTETLHGVGVASPTDVLAVGEGGTILRYDGTTWSTMASPTGRTLNDVWMASPDKAFAVGDYGTALEYNGTDWGTMDMEVSEFLNGVWGASSGEVFAVGWSTVGPTGVVHHWDGAQWQRQEAPQGLSGVWGSSPTDVYAVGAQGTVLHRQDGTWSPITVSGVDSSLQAVWGSGQGDVFVVGTWGAAFRYWPAAGWQPIGLVSPHGSGVHHHAVWGSSASDVHVVGENGSSYHFDGSSWRLTSSSVTVENLTGVWGRSGTEIYAVGNGVVLRFDGARWKVERDEPGAIWRGVWGTADEVWVVGHGAGSGGKILRHKEGQWGVVDAGTIPALFAVWGSGPTDVFMVGENETVLHYDGSVLRRPDLTGESTQLRAVWGSGPDDVYLAGDGGTLLRYRPISLQVDALKSGVTQSLNALCGRSPSDIYAVGDGGVVLHYDGQNWTPMTSGTNVSLYACWCGGNEVWAAGQGGTVIRCESGSGTWTREASGAAATFSGLWGTATGDVVVVGSGGAILRRGPDK